MKSYRAENLWSYHRLDLKATRSCTLSSDETVVGPHCCVRIGLSPAPTKCPGRLIHVPILLVTVVAAFHAHTREFNGLSVPIIALVSFCFCKSFFMVGYIDLLTIPWSWVKSCP